MAIENNGNGWGSPLADVAAAPSATPETQSAPISGNLQAPQQAQQPITLQNPQAAPAKPAIDLEQHNKFVGKMYHNILSGLGGAQSETPVTDSDQKSPTYGQTKMVATPKTPGSQWRSIIAASIAGLSAGAAQGYDQKKPFAGIAAGANAENAQQDKQKQANQQALQQKRQEFEDTQRAKLQQANILESNAHALEAFHNSVNNQNSMDPTFAANKSIVDELQKLPTGPDVQVMSAKDAMDKMKDSNYSHTHIMLGLGSAPKMGVDADGNPIELRGPDNVPMTEGRVALIDGGHDGKFDVPAGLSSQIQDLGKKGLLDDVTGWDKITPGQSISMKEYLSLQNAISKATNDEQKGWAEKTPGDSAVADPNKPGSWLQHNTATNATREYPGGVPQNVLSKAATINNKDDKGEVSPALKYTQDREDARAARAAQVKAGLAKTDKNLAQSYSIQNREFDTVRKPVETQLDSFSTLRSSLDQGNATGDSVVAPALLKALVAGGGVRITQAEISNFTHGRSSLEDLKGVLQKMSSGKSITPDQRAQVYSLLGAVESKAQQKRDALAEGQERLDTAETVAEQRAAVRDTRAKLGAIDGAKANPQNGQAGPAPTPESHSVSLKAALAKNPGATEAQVRAAAAKKGYSVTE
jgi:hypothetical protein